MTKNLTDLIIDLYFAKAVLFDFDQTLAETQEACWNLADQKFVESFGKLKRDDHQKLFNEFWKSEKGQKYNTNDRAIEFFKRFYNIECEDVFGAIMPHVKEAYANVELLPGAFELIDYLKNVDKKIAIVTSGHAEYLNEFLDRNQDFKELIDVIVTSDTEEVKNNPKPKPDPYIYAMNKLGVTSDECIVFEDIEEGRIAASQAGIKTCIIANPNSNLFHNREEFNDLVAKADYYIDTYEVFLEEEVTL